MAVRSVDVAMPVGGLVGTMMIVLRVGVGEIG